MSIPTRDWFPEAHWLRDYPRSKMGNRPLGAGAVLRLETLSCERKNELSKDEISFLVLWSKVDGDLSGLVTKDLVFGRPGETNPLGLELQLDRLWDGDVLIVLVYERDTPPLDPHDPIGAVSFFPKETYSVFPGDFRKPGVVATNHLMVGRPTEILIDGGRNGSYRLAFSVIRE